MSDTHYTESHETKTLSQRIGHGLRVARLRAKCATTAAAKHVGVAPETMRRYERGDGIPSSLTLFRLAEFYGASFEDLARDGKFTLPRSRYA
jgi:transcriptional regulator with XRE-family HTH domain